MSSLRNLVCQYHGPAKCRHCISLSVAADHGFHCGRQRQVALNHRYQVCPPLNQHSAFGECMLPRVLIAATVVAQSGERPTTLHSYLPKHPSPETTCTSQKEMDSCSRLTQCCSTDRTYAGLCYLLFSLAEESIRMRLSRPPAFFRRWLLTLAHAKVGSILDIASTHQKPP